MKENETEISNLRNAIETIEKMPELMPIVNTGTALSLDISALLERGEIEEMLVEALEKKIASLKEENEKYKLGYEDRQATINGMPINQEAEDEVDWKIEDRESFIETLKYEWIPDAKQAGRDSDLFLMEEDVEYLEGFSDRYILSSMSTNAYLIPSNSGDTKEFEEICERLLKESEGN